MGMERIGFRTPPGFTAPEFAFYPTISAKEFLSRFQDQLGSDEPIQLGYLKNVFISVEKKNDTIVMVLLSGVSERHEHSQGMAFALRSEGAVGLVTQLGKCFLHLHDIDPKSSGKMIIDFADGKFEIKYDYD